MATVNYYLKGALSETKIKALEIGDKAFLQKKLDTPLQIYLKLSVGGERIQIYTKKRIAQKLWDERKQEADCVRFKNGGVKLNEWLAELKSQVRNFAEENENAGKYTTSSDLKEILSKKTIKKSAAIEFDDYFQAFLANQKTSDGHSLKPNTIKKYNGFYNHLKEFAESGRFKLQLKNIDKTFLIQFKAYLIKYEKELPDKSIEKLSDNTIAKYIKGAKSFIRHYMNKGLINHFNIAEVKSVEREGEIFVLPIKQVVELQNHIFENERLSMARDVFCFMCWTGQRFSDIERIQHKDITMNESGEKVWKLITQKTNTRVTVPITHYAEEILAKYRTCETPIPVFSNQKLNDALKDLGKDIGFNHYVKVVKYYDGVKKEESLPFHDVLTTHVARKSYITNSLILGTPERVVRDVSGHKDEKSFRRYVNLAEAYKTSAIKKAFSVENISRFL